MRESRRRTAMEDGLGSAARRRRFRVHDYVRIGQGRMTQEPMTQEIKVLPLDILVVDDTG